MRARAADGADHARARAADGAGEAADDAGEAADDAGGAAAGAGGAQEPDDNVWKYSGWTGDANGWWDPRKEGGEEQVEEN